MNDKRPLRILIANIWLLDRTGTETLVRDLALNFRRRGHFPTVYALRLGEPAEELRALGVPVVDDLDLVKEPPDIIQSSHNVPMVMALARFPDCPAVWLSQDWRWWYDRPPRFSRITAYVAIDEPRRTFLMRELGVAKDHVGVWHNAVDLSRIPVRPAPLPDRPRRAIAFTKTGTQLAMLREVCDRAGIEFSAIGRGPDMRVVDPERQLVSRDIVFATGRSAIEALAAGCAVIVGDARGFAGLVTMANYEWLRDRNFGSEAFTGEMTGEAVAQEIARYDRVDAEAVARTTRDRANLDSALDRLESIYRDGITSSHRMSGWTADDCRMLRDFVHAWPPGTQAPEWRFAAELERLQGLRTGLDRQFSGLPRWYLTLRRLWRWMLGLRGRKSLAR